ncbi:MAG: VCBS domain-containing protein [Rhizomicrobium sp.]
MLASGALLTVNADGTFDYDPNHAFDALPAAGSGASNTVGHDSFTYTLAGGSTATVSIAVNGVDSDDTLQGTSGNDNFDGGIGDDTVVFTGAATDYSATYNPVTHAYTFIDNRSGHPGGTDTVKNVEFFKTSDGVTTIGLDFAGRIETLSFIANDGSTKFAQFDRAEVHNWEEIVTDHDIAGNLTMQTATMDNGGTWVNTYDPTDANAMLTDTKHFDPEDRLIQETVTRDDGTHLLSVYDIYNQFAWADATLTYDANWNFVSISGHRDNASTTISLSEVRPFLDTLLWFATPFDPNYDSRPAGDDPDEQRRHRRALRP